MKKYLSFFRIRFTNSLQYRAAALAGIVTQFAWGILELLLFRAFYETDPAAFPMGFEQLSSHIWFNQAFLSMFMVWFFDKDIFKSITDGNVAYELTRPMNLYTMWFTKNMAVRLSKALLRCFPVLIFAILLPRPYGLSAPASPLAFFMFLYTGILAFLNVISYCMLIYILTFYTMNPTGVNAVASVLADIFTGAYIPLPFLPEKLQTVIGFTPFAVMQNLPFRVYSGSISGGEMWHLAGMQLFWLSVMIGGGMLLMRSALRRVVVQGG